MNNIDIIIPAYNVPDYILTRCLASILEQNIYKEVKITIIDDASETENYEQVISRFPELEINIIRSDVNGGPGDARQIGLSATNNPFVIFIDADDTLYGSFALYNLRKPMLDNKINIMVSSIFIEVHDECSNNITFLPHQQDLVWMFGKMYKRDFLKRNNIHFLSGSRANEDNGFNTLIRLCATEQEQVCFTGDITYIWHEKEDSITRANNCEYSYGGGERNSFYGYTDNMIFAIKEAKKRRPYNGYITMWSVSCMLNLYEYYLECVERSPSTAAANFDCCKKFYKEIYQKMEVTDEMLTAAYNEIMRNAYTGNKLVGIIPSIGIKEFLEKLKREQ